MTFTIEHEDPRKLRLIGELDLGSEEELTAALTPLVADDGDLVLDLAKLSFVDSSGVRGFIRGATELGDRGTLILRSPTDPVRRVLELMRVDAVSNVRIAE